MASGRLLATIPRLSTEWSVEFTFRLTTSSSSSPHCSVIHLTQGENAVNVGDRAPAVFLDGIPTISQTSFFSATHGEKNHAFITARVPVVDEPTHIEIHQRYISGGKYRYFIKWNGEEIYSVVDEDAQQFYNVKVYASDPWYDACPAFIKNFSITNFL